MAVTVRIPTPLRRFANEEKDVRLEAASVGAALDELFTKCPQLRPYLVDDGGKVRNFVNVFVNGDDIRALDGRETLVKDGDTLAIVPAIAGGAVAAPDAPAPAKVDLTREEVLRYSRHLIMPEVTIEGQRRLKAGSVLLIGAGGLGSPASLYLAAAGVGRIGLVDFDVVDETNLQRQIVHDTRAVGRKKLDSARERLEGLNPHIRVETHEAMFTRENALDLVAAYDVVVDGTDNFQTRYLTNDACFFLKKPNVYGSIFRFEGQASVFWPEKGPCYRCLYPEPPPPGLVPSCAEGGVLGILPGVVGCIQATEAIKILLGIGEPLVGRLLLYDALAMSFKELRLRRNAACALCGEERTITELQDYDAFCGLTRGEEAAGAATSSDISVQNLKQRLDRGDDISVIDVREPHEWAICHLDGATLMPLGTLPERLHELDSAKTYAVHCKMGARSAKAVDLLKKAGFKRVHNVAGGIQAWAKEVDPSVPVY